MTTYHDFQNEVTTIRANLGSDLNSTEGLISIFLQLLHLDAQPWSERRFGKRLAECGAAVWNLCYTATPPEQRSQMADLALGMLRAGLRLAPDDEGMWAKLGAVSVQSFRFDAACAAFEKASELYEKEGAELSPYAKTYAAVAYVRTGALSRARRLATEALQSEQLDEDEMSLARAMLQQTDTV